VRILLTPQAPKKRLNSGRALKRTDIHLVIEETVYLEYISLPYFSILSDTLLQQLHYGTASHISYVFRKLNIVYLQENVRRFNS
jgi:hypothetical protein